MRMQLVVFDWEDRWHAYVEEIFDAGQRKHARRRRLWTRTYHGMPPLVFTSVLDVLEECLKDAGRPRLAPPREAGSAPPGGPRGDLT